LVKILAEPTVMALSGQEAHFLAGGKVFIPTSTPNGMGGSMVTLTEQEYGVSLHFLPKVLEGDQIWLTVSPEVSELNPQGITVGSGSGLAPTILPTFTTRRASTTVQLRDGEHFVIGGLVRNNVTASVNAVPFLGEIPLLGALFRSPDFQSDKTELVFVVTPHLMQPSDAPPVLPTDGYHEPGPVQRLLGGRLEGHP
ncbi:MAG: type II and III secretion system protein family protein, partial [Betaproteobacteria bacterium]|nr:type II and III secretion system protein family protein [Betaproteobacteria bacterium]